MRLGADQITINLASEEMICPEAREAGLFQDGGYAEYIRVPARRYLYPIGELDPVQAAPLGCGGLTPYRAVKHAQPWLGQDSAGCRDSARYFGFPDFGRQSPKG